MNKGIAVAVLVAILSGVWLLVIATDTAEAPVEPINANEFLDSTAATPESDNNQIDEVAVEPLQFSIDEEDSIWLVVNKTRPISLTYEPRNLRPVAVTVNTAKSQAELSMRDDAATALEELFAAAELDEVLLLLGSGYRDAELQEFYYTNYVNTFGQEEADKFSAKPGTSEHQTGLVADVAPASNTCYLDTCFSTTFEGQWVADNAHKYGFIIRYPEGKEEITGYQFEPWHIRYVGAELATEMYNAGQTMEEYFELI